MAQTHIPAGLPGWKRADCLGCGERVTAARDAHVTIVGTRTATWLAMFPSDPLLIATTGEVPASEELVLLGVAHRECADLARSGLESHVARLPKELPSVSIDEPPPFEYMLHRPSEASECPFCGNEDDLTDEHVWPKWFSRELRSMGATFPSSKREHKVAPYVDVTVPVCGKCNHVWMSVLENDAARVMSPMLHARNVTLERADQEVLATWPSRPRFSLTR